MGASSRSCKKKNVHNVYTHSTSLDLSVGLWLVPDSSVDFTMSWPQTVNFLSCLGEKLQSSKKESLYFLLAVQDLLSAVSELSLFREGSQSHQTNRI